MVDPNADRGLKRSGDAILVTLPFAWLTEVWTRELMTIFGRMCLGANTDDGVQWTLDTVAPNLAATAQLLITIGGKHGQAAPVFTSGRGTSALVSPTRNARIAGRDPQLPGGWLSERVFAARVSLSNLPTFYTTLVDFRSQLHCCQKTAAPELLGETSARRFAAAKSLRLVPHRHDDAVATISVLTLLRRVRSTSLPAVVKRLLLASLNRACWR